MARRKKMHRWKGCCMDCAAWIRGHGKYQRMKPGDLRRAGGKRAVKRSAYQDV